MTVSLDVTPAGDIAVLRGVDSEAALAHLCRSLVTGSVFDVYRALVIDLDGRDQLDAEAVYALASASDALRRRRRWLGIAERHGDVAPAVAQARQWLRLVDGDRAIVAAVRVARSQLAFAVGTTAAAVEVASSIVRRVLPGGGRR